MFSVHNFAYWENLQFLRCSTSVHHECKELFSRFRFDHVQEFVLPVTEELLDHCAEGALSIEVYGHRKPTYQAYAQAPPQQQHQNGIAEEDEEAEAETEAVKEEEDGIVAKEDQEKEEEEEWDEEEQQAKARSLADR